MIVQWVIALISLIFLIWYSRKIKKYLFKTINLKPKWLRLISFPFLPILLLFVFSLLSLVCKNWTNQLAIFLIEHHEEILDNKIYYLSNVIRFISSFSNSIISTVLLLFYFLNWNLKAMSLILFYMMVYAFAWAWNVLLLNTTSGSLLEISLLQDIAVNNFTFAYTFTKNTIGEIAGWLPFIFFIIMLFFNRDTKAVKS